jgi:prophage regulatory protein
MESTAELIRIKDVSELVSVSRSHIYRQIEAGLFPPPVKIGRSSRWRRSDLDRLVREGRYVRDRDDGQSVA